MVAQLGIDVPVMKWAEEEGVDNEEIMTRLAEASDKFMAEKSASFGDETMRNIEKQILLQTIDVATKEPAHYLHL